MLVCCCKLLKPKIWYLVSSRGLPASTTSFSHIGLHSMLGFCWHWSFIQHASSLCETFFHIFLSRSSALPLCLVRFSRCGLAALNGYKIYYYYYYYITKCTLIALALRADRNVINLLKPNDIYICRTAALNSRRYILNIYLTNIHTEYFKHAA